MNNFVKYQVIRKYIETRSLKWILSKMGNIALSYKIGIKREYRAYQWIKAKYSTWDVKISDKKDDLKGIDIIAIKGKDIIKFAISGHADKEKKETCDYKIIVGKDKIWQVKIK